MKIWKILYNKLMIYDLNYKNKYNQLISNKMK